MLINGLPSGLKAFVWWTRVGLENLTCELRLVTNASMFQVLYFLLGVPMGLEVSKFNRTLVLVITKSLVNMKSLALYNGLFSIHVSARFNLKRRTVSIM